MKTPIALIIAGAFALSACTPATTTSPAAGAAVGGVLGAITATALGANDEWLVIGTLTGAAAGALVAQNQQSGECAYSDGRGGFVRAAC